MLYPKCTDMIQARITKRFRLDSSIKIGTPRNRNHGSDSETTVWHANCWQHYVPIILKSHVLISNKLPEKQHYLPRRTRTEAGREVDLSPCTDTASFTSVDRTVPQCRYCNLTSAICLCLGSKMFFSSHILLLPNPANRVSSNYVLSVVLQSVERNEVVVMSPFHRRVSARIVLLYYCTVCLVCPV